MLINEEIFLYGVCICMHICLYAYLDTYLHTHKISLVKTAQTHKLSAQVTRKWNSFRIFLSCENFDVNKFTSFRRYLPLQHSLYCRSYLSKMEIWYKIPAQFLWNLKKNETEMEEWPNPPPLIFPISSFWGTERRTKLSLLLLKIWKNPMLVFRYMSNSISLCILTESILHFPMVIILKRCNILISSKAVSNKVCVISVTWREERSRIYVGKSENLRRNALALGKQKLNGTTTWKLL